MKRELESYSVAVRATAALAVWSSDIVLGDGQTRATCPLPPHLKHWTESSTDVPFVAGVLAKARVAVRKGPPPLCPPSCRDSSFKRRLITESTLSSLRGAVSSETMREE